MRTKETPERRKANWEIGKILDTTCKTCDLTNLINELHGPTAKLAYCNRICPVGKRLQELSKKLQRSNKDEKEIFDLR